MMLPFIWQKPGEKTIAKKCLRIASILKRSVIVVSFTLSSCNWLVQVDHPLGSGYSNIDFSLVLELHPQSPGNTLIDLRVTNNSNQNMCISNDVQFYYDDYNILQLCYGDNLVNEAGLSELHYTLKPGSTFTLHKDMAFGIYMVSSMWNVRYGKFNGGYLKYASDADSSKIFASTRLQLLDFYF